MGLDPLEELDFGDDGTSLGHRHELTLLSQLGPRVAMGLEDSVGDLSLQGPVRASATIHYVHQDSYGHRFPWRLGRYLKEAS